MDPKKISAWIALPGALLAAIIYIATQWGAIEDGWAQEAQRMGEQAGKQAAEQYMEPMQKSLYDIDMKLQRDFVEGKWEQCMTILHQDLSSAEREILCDDERDWRWDHWEWEQCVEHEMQEDPEVAVPEDAIPICGVEPQQP